MAYGAFAAAQKASLQFIPMAHMQEYLDELAAKGKNPDYVRTVRNGLHWFNEFLRGENVVAPEEITRVHIIRFQASCNQRVEAQTWSKSYSLQVMKKVRAWINWLYRLNYITTMPWREIHIPVVPKEPKPLSDEEVMLLFQTHRRDAFGGQLDPFRYHRRELALVLLYSWGLRIHELASLTVAQMDQRNDFVRVINKGGKKKSQPYTPEIKATVARFLAQRARYAKPGEDALLINMNGDPWGIEKIRADITGLGRSAGIEINPHRLRDTCGTNLLDDDVPVERVQKLFGHSNQAQTLAYANVNDKKLYESIEASMDPRIRDLLFLNTRDFRV